MALSYYFGQWLIQQLVLPHKPRFTFKDLQRAISQLFGDHPHKMRLKSLQHHSGIHGIVKSLNHKSYVKFINTSFAAVHDEKFLSIRNSMKVFLKWC